MAARRELSASDRKVHTFYGASPCRHGRSRSSWWWL